MRCRDEEVSLNTLVVAPSLLDGGFGGRSKSCGLRYTALGKAIRSLDFRRL